MSIEGTSEAGRHHFEASGKKSKKARKRKACLDTENENVENSNGLPNSNEAVPTITGSEEAQPMPPLKKSKKKEKVLEDIEQQVQGSIKKTEDNERQRVKRKKRVKFDLESSNMSSDQEKREPVEEDVHEYPISVHGNNGDKELNKPNDTTWVQKASWKSLVGETGRVSFSLGSIVGHNSGALPGNNRELASTAPAKPSMDGQSSNAVSAWIEGSSSALLSEFSSPPNGHSSLSHVKNISKLVKKAENPSKSEILDHQSVRARVVENGLKRDPQKVESAKRGLDLKQAVQSEHQIVGDKNVCRFMRSDNYEQEWLEAKRAVKDIFKRSRKDALKSMKMFHKKHNH